MITKKEIPKHFLTLFCFFFRWCCRTISRCHLRALWHSTKWPACAALPLGMLGRVYTQDPSRLGEFALIWVVMLFAIILLHEFGHCFAARRMETKRSLPMI